jgi:hypothetical protein
MFGRWKIQVRRLRNPLHGSHDWYEMTGTTVCRPIWNGKANIEEFEASDSVPRTHDSRHLESDRAADERSVAALDGNCRSGSRRKRATARLRKVSGHLDDPHVQGSTLPEFEAGLDAVFGWIDVGHHPA